jgi:hypothetical protein
MNIKEKEKNHYNITAEKYSICPTVPPPLLSYKR